MKNQSIQFKVCWLILSAMMTASHAGAGELELSDDVNLKIARIKAKSRQMEHQGVDDYIDIDDKRDDMFDENNADCGSVDIGNLETSNRPTFGRTEMQTIVIGDVINTGNRC